MDRVGFVMVIIDKPIGVDLQDVSLNSFGSPILTGGSAFSFSSMASFLVVFSRNANAVLSCGFEML